MWASLLFFFAFYASPRHCMFVSISEEMKQLSPVEWMTMIFPQYLRFIVYNLVCCRWELEVMGWWTSEWKEAEGDLRFWEWVKGLAGCHMMTGYLVSGGNN